MADEWAALAVLAKRYAAHWCSAVQTGEQQQTMVLRVKRAEASLLDHLSLHCIHGLASWARHIDHHPQTGNCISCCC
jgi:hypothetical protein